MEKYQGVGVKDSGRQMGELVLFWCVAVWWKEGTTLAFGRNASREATSVFYPCKFAEVHPSRFE